MPHEQEVDQLHNVHDAMEEAALEVSKSPKMVVGSFKIEPEFKELTAKICKSNGTTMSRFLRQCCRKLIEDYQGKRADG